ncbi:MAG: glycosyltransferase [Aequorivita sp.]|nr:glycosyltransferase [Aequorivita sp.]|tara:strand:- start:86339 stop:87589 length:1251 start_codon:yes stop_codon:yes gene_type:complete
MELKKLLIIGHTFPEPNTTAAGSRMMQLIKLFKEENYQITFASTASVSEQSENLESLHITIKNIRLNDAAFDAFIKKLNPEVVIFDRFVTEEQFGWRVAEQCPNTLKILDTEDLHFLRKAREEAVKKDSPVSKANLFSDTAKRELASILRCDLSLIISEYEMELLKHTFKIPEAILYYLPLLIEQKVSKKQLPPFEEREHFLAIGNLLHAPNVDSVLQLKQLWPKIRKQLPKAQLHIFGAYAPQKIQQLHNKNQGFLIKGWAESTAVVMSKYRVQLAPLRFGAGLKGKFLDAMQLGLPSVTTPIGAEGFCGNFTFGGSVTTSKVEFMNSAIDFYKNETSWEEAQKNGFQLVQNRFKKELFAKDFKTRLLQIARNLKKHRELNFFGQILQHHSLQSTKYLSKWIESKELIKIFRDSY